MRLDSISSLKFVEPAQGAHVVRRKQRRQTRHFKQHSKLKKSARSRFTDTIPNGSQKPCGYAYRLVTLMTTSTSPTRIHLSGMSSEKPCAMMSVEISEMKSTFIAISFCKTRCLPTAGFVLHPPKLLSSGPHQGVMRLDSISSLKFVEPAQGAHAVRRKRRRWTHRFKQHSKTTSTDCCDLSGSCEWLRKFPHSFQE